MINQVVRILDDVRPTELAGVRVARVTTGRVRQAALRALQGGPRTKFAEIIVMGMLPTLTKAMMVGHSLGARRSRLMVKQLAPKRVALAIFDDVLAAVKAKRELDLSVLKDEYEPRAFQVLMGLGKKVDERLQDAIDELIASGASTREATRVLGEVLEKAGVSGTKPSQLETLFRTQLQVSFNAGRWQADQDPDIQEILWGYKYVTVGDDRVRPEHEALDGTTLPKDDPFWSTFWPPNGWNCRCQAIPIFEERAIKKPGLVDGLPAEPDEGFGFNAGETLQDAMLE